MDVNLSSSFMFRTRCKFCLERPQYYSFGVVLHHHLHRDWKKAIESNNSWLKILKYGKAEPRDQQSFPMFFAKVTSQYKSHREDNIAENGMIDIASCSCGRSIWMFKLTDRLAIKNRKSSIMSPNQLTEIS